MEKRWRDRILVLRPKEKALDAWGCVLPLEFDEGYECWADIKLLLGAKMTALVSVRSFFPKNKDIQVRWSGRNWRVVQRRGEDVRTDVVQFKMEELQ